jgi:hypothetical protein
LQLSVLQSRKIAPLLDASKAANGREGVLCTLARHYEPTRGTRIIELQLVQVTPAKVRKLLKGLADLTMESSNMATNA